MVHIPPPTRRRAAVRLAGAVLAAAGAAGCARIAAVSEVHPDGSMTRTLTIHGSAPAAAPPGNAAGADAAASPSFGPNLHDLIALPTTAGGWKVTRTREEKTGVVITATRTLAAGAAIHNDLGIKAGADASGQTPAVAGGLLIENTASVRTVAPGQMEYREVLHWRGPRPKDLDAPNPEMQAALKRALPPALAADQAAAGRVQKEMTNEIWRLLFGPGDPLLPTLAFHPDLAAYRLRQQLHEMVRQSLKNAYGDRLTPAQAEAAVNSLVTEAAANMQAKTQTHAPDGGPPGSDSGADSSGDNTPPIALLMRVKLPGKVTATNGQIDPQTGEVYWALYSEAPAVSDVTLTATCATTGQQP